MKYPNPAKVDLIAHLRAAATYVYANDWNECERMLSAALSDVDRARSWSTRRGAKSRDRAAREVERERLDAMGREGVAECNR